MPRPPLYVAVCISGYLVQNLCLNLLIYLTKDPDFGKFLHLYLP